MNDSGLPEYEIRNLRADEYPLLKEFLYEAIFVPADYDGEVSCAIIYDDPMCRAAFEYFVTREDYIALVTTLGDNPIGACWMRTTNKYGQIDDRTPSFSISLYEQYRGNGMAHASSAPNIALVDAMSLTWLLLVLLVMVVLELLSSRGSLACPAAGGSRGGRGRHFLPLLDSM